MVCSPRFRRGHGSIRWPSAAGRAVVAVFLTVGVGAAVAVPGTAEAAGTPAPGPNAVEGFGSATTIASGARPAGPVAAMASVPGGGGYWTVSATGEVTAEGDAVSYGSVSGPLAAPVVGMAATADGGGYWLVASDGGIFSFGDAVFEGSGTGGSLESPAVGLATRPGGYWVAFGQTAPVATVLGQQELLAILGYLPVRWTPAGFIWRWQDTPASLERLWAPGQDTVVLRGAITAFEAHVGLPLDGNISAPETAALEAAAADPGAGADLDGYTYAVASENLPETLTVWHNGVVVATSAANTGGPGTATAQGTWPVYERLRAQIMTGTDPDGASYADPVQFVAYFHGSDAVHYIARATYGSPQSLGCVELPLAAAALVWPYLGYGTLVTVD